jgi:hypothetical protein
LPVKEVRAPDQTLETREQEMWVHAQRALDAARYVRERTGLQGRDA